MTTTPQPTETPRQARGITRGMTVLVLLAGGVLALIGATQTWITATGFEAAHINSVQLSGQEASPVITAMALVVVAAGAALSIARNLGRWVVGMVAILAAITMATVTLSVTFNPAAAVAIKIAETTGTTGVASAVEHLSVSILPWLTVVGAVIAFLGGFLTLTSGRRWSAGKTKKYDLGHQSPVVHDGPLDEIDTWDELSRGEDPT